MGHETLKKITGKIHCAHAENKTEPLYRHDPRTPDMREAP